MWHVPDHLLLDWFAEDTRTKSDERSQRHCCGRAGVVQFDDVEVVVVIQGFDGCTDLSGVRFEVIEADLHGFLRL